MDTRTGIARFTATEFTDAADPGTAGWADQSPGVNLAPPRRRSGEDHGRASDDK